jgi:hypothetical protein
MDRKTRSSLGIGILLVLIGGFFLAVQFLPNMGNWFWHIFDWPVYIIGAGACLLVFGLVIGAPGMAVPACIVAGIGGILYYQNATGDWESWAYIWALIPGFTGVGGMLASLLGGRGTTGFRSSLTLVLISLVMFLVFGAFFGANPLGDYWPILLIALGVWMLVQPLFKKKTGV